MMCSRCYTEDIIETWIPYGHSQNKIVRCANCGSHSLIEDELLIRTIKINKIKGRCIT